MRFDSTYRRARLLLGMGLLFFLGFMFPACTGDSIP